MSMNRREFLTTAIASAGAAVMAERLGAAGASPDPYELVPLGKTGLKVTRVGFGTGMRGGGRQTNLTRMGMEKATALLKFGYERGIRLFDMADMYGTHPFVAAALKGLPREKLVYVSKIWVRPGGIPEKERPDADVLVDRFRKELDTDYIDLLLIHCMTDADWTDKQKRQMDIMANLKAKGIIKAHGVSVHSLAALKAAAESPWVDSVHARINPYGVAMDGKPEDVVPVLKKFREAGKGVVGMKIIGEGRFRDSDQQRDESVKYVLGLGCVDTLIIGFEKTEEIVDFENRVRKALAAASPVPARSEAAA